MRGLSPASGLRNYYGSIGYPLLEDIKVKLLQETQHGKLTIWGYHDKGPAFFRYDPDPGYLGDDQAVFLVEYGGKVFKTIYTIKVLEVVDDRSPTCPDPVMIKAPKACKTWGPPWAPLPMGSMVSQL